MKDQFLKMQTKNKHLVTKSVEVKKAIKKLEILQLEYMSWTKLIFKPIMTWRIYKLTMID